jgi:hypothetical protein
MNRALLVAVGIMALIAFAVWFFARPIAPATVDQQTSSSTVETVLTSTSTDVVPEKPAVKNTAKPGTANTYKSLLTQSGSYQCDYSQVRSSGQSTNVIYIYGGKLRAEFRTSENGDTTANLVVYDGHYMYQWREGASTGTRTALTSLSQLPLVIPKDLTSGKIYGTNYESVGWICHPWLTNKSLLTPPSYVAFQ